MKSIVQVLGGLTTILMIISLIVAIWCDPQYNQLIGKILLTEGLLIVIFYFLDKGIE